MKAKRKFKGLSLSFIFIFSLILMNANVGAVSISTNETATISTSVVDGTDDEYLVTVGFDGKLEEIGASNQKLDVVLLLDNSGSMSGTPLATAKDNSKTFASEILANPNNNVSVICFGSNATNYIHLNNSVTDTHAAIDTISTNGLTYLGSGIDEVKNEFDTYGRSDAKKVLVVLADGDTSDVTGYNASTAALLSAYPGLTIKTIGYEIYAGSSAETTLVNLAAQDASSGKYYNASTDDLSTVFTDIATAIQSSVPEVNVDIVVPENFTLVEDSVEAATAASITSADGKISANYLNVAPNSSHTIQFRIKIDQTKATNSDSYTANNIPVTYTYDYVDNGQPKQKTSELSVDAPIYQITTKSDGNGIISSGRFVGRGASHTVSFSANEGYELISLKDNDVAQSVDGDAYALTGIANDHKVEVRFEKPAPVKTITSPSAKPSTAPATGDATNIGLWIAVVGISSMVFVSFFKRKSSR